MKDRAKRLKKARELAGYDTATDAAKAMGIAYSTYAGHENGSRKFDIDEAKRYARMFRVRWDWIMEGVANGKTQPELTPAPLSLASVPVLGNVSAGTWLEVQEGDAAEVNQFVQPDVKFPAMWQYAFRVEGTSLNKIAEPGSILICVDLIKSGTNIQDNDLVIVERTRFAGQMMERTAKRVRKVISGYELWPESTDPEHQKPIRINGGDEGEEVRVAAKVLWIMRQP